MPAGEVMPDIRSLLITFSLFLLPASSSLAAHLDKPPLPYPDDGCTCFPESRFDDCCRAHDRIYYQGGTKEDRLKADHELRQCIRNKGYSIMDDVLYFSVRIGGVPWVPTPWRWGFGYPYKEGHRGYASQPGTPLE